MLLCVPDATEPCYEGPAGTEGVGACKPGTRTCNAAGTAYGSCEGQVLPAVEDCATAGDEDCSGPKPECAAHVWSKRYGDNASQQCDDIAADAAGNVLLAGRFEGTVDFGAGPMTSAGVSDAFLAKLDPDGNALWAKRFGDAMYQQTWSVAADPAGNIFIAGAFLGSIDFGGGSLVSAGNQDIFVAKLDPGGALLWAKRFGDAAFQSIYSIAVDPGGGVAMIGSFKGVVDFGGGPLTSSGSETVCVVKLDAMGNHVFSKRFGEGGPAYGPGIAVDAAGNVLVTGSFTSSIDLGGGPLTTTGSDAFIGKLSPAGAHIWSRQSTGAMDSSSRKIAADAAGTVRVSGNFAGTVDMGSGPLTSQGEDDVFLAAYDAAGTPLWSKAFGGPASESMYGMAGDAAGNTLITGYSYGPADFGGGPLPGAGAQDIFLAKLGPGGQHIWSRRFGDDEDQMGRSVAFDPQGYALVAGDMRGTVDFGGGALMSSTIWGDAFAAKLAP